MATRWWIEHEGRRLEIEPESMWSGNVVRLFADGEQIGEVKKHERRITVEAEGLSVTTWLAWHGGTIQRAELRVPGESEPRPLQPAPGTRAARREAWAREHPALYSARHALGGIGQVLIGLVGIAALLRVLPDISIDVPLPSIDLPLPSIPSPDLPDVDLPDMPGWVQAIRDSSRYWGPVLIGLALAWREYDRRKKQARREAQERAGEDSADAAAGADAPARDRAHAESADAGLPRGSR